MHTNGIADSDQEVLDLESASAHTEEIEEVEQADQAEEAEEAQIVAPEEGETEPEPEDEAEPEGETESEPEPEDEAEDEAEPEGETEPETEGEGESEGETEPESETEDEAEAEPEPEPKHARIDLPVIEPDFIPVEDNGEEELELDFAPSPDQEVWEPNASVFGEGYAGVSAAHAYHRPTGKKAKEAKRKAAAKKADDQSRRAAHQSEPAAEAAPTVTHSHAKAKKSKKGPLAATALVVLCLAGAGGAYGYHWYQTHPVQITLDGEAMTVQDQQRTIQGLVDDGTISLSAGNHLAIDGSVLKKKGGEPDVLELNGTEADDAAYKQLLMEGDQLTITRGKDTTEESTVEDEVKIPHRTSVSGYGAIHLYAQGNGKDGTKGVTTGKESGIVIDDVVEEPQNVKVVEYSVKTKDKVIALTFDDGPWPTTTEKILNVLKKNDAKATFFTIGNQIESRSDLVKRAYDEGHQICTHTWSHASGSGQGVNITYMSPSEQRRQITKGFDAIEAVTGEKASTVVRLPGGNVNKSTFDNLSSLITAEVNWDIDTMDWSRPGVESIYKSIMRARSGDIILMHDGGGDRTQTVKALKKALPELTKKGYTFVTMDELIKEYPNE